MEFFAKTIKNSNKIKGIPDNSKLTIKLESIAVITEPISVYLNTPIKSEAKNINTSIFPIPSKEYPNDSETSLFDFIVLAKTP